ncbi:MAG: aminotransferase class V-fold PLP-dependent enzyme [Rhodovibrionaceae bacterium]
MTIDVARARAETPGCAQRTHLNNAGAGLMPQAVLDAQIAHLRLEAEIGGYEAHAAAQDKVDAAYAAVARLLNCAPTEVALMENATAAWSGAFSAFTFEPGDRILTAEAEYSANFIAYLQAARRCEVKIEPVPSEDNGQLDVAALQNMIDDRVKLIGVTHVPTNGGLVNPAEEIGQVACAAGIPYLIDACQSAGQLDLNVEKIGCDLLSVTGRKYLRGPRGSGFLYVRQSFLEARNLEPAILDMHGAEWVEPDDYRVLPNARRFENWEFNYAAVIGLGVAVDYALSWGLPAIEARVIGLADSLRAQAAEIPGIAVHDLGTKRCGICSLSSDRVDSKEIKARMTERGINTSVSPQTSTLLDTRKRNLPPVLRASVHYYNSEAEVERFISALAEIAA